MSNDDLVTRLRLLSKWMEDVGFVVAEADEAAARITELEAELDAAEIERGKARRTILDLRAENARLREAGQQMLETIIWMSGADAFSPDGGHHDEWVRARDRVFAAWAALNVSDGNLGEPT